MRDVQSVPNHRANDVVVLEGSEQVLTAKFMYGALDMSALSKEKVAFCDNISE